MDNMNLLRSKQNKEAREQTQALLSTSCDDYLQEVLKDARYAHHKSTAVAATLFEELALEPWLADQCATRGAKRMFPQLVANPIYDLDALQTRQEAARRLGPSRNRVGALLTRLKDLEPDVLWIFGLPPQKSKKGSREKDWPFRMLFPQWPVMSMINHLPPLLAFYHLFRSYLAPWSNLFYPLTTIFGPYIYVKRTLKWPLSLGAYLAMLRLALQHMLRPASAPMATVMRYITFLAYVGMFLYGVIQSFDLAAMLRDFVNQLQSKLDSIREFVATYQTLQQELESICRWDPVHWCAFLPAPVSRKAVAIPEGMTGMYALWTDSELRMTVQSMLHHVYGVDIAHATLTLQRTRGWTTATYGDTTKLWAMGHPLLASQQIRNPLSLDKNIIITGPNAAGKTTYMKAICCNQLLAQSLGVVCARRGVVQVVHAIGSFIRVADTIGKDSLFEAEAKRCADMIEEATRIQEGGQRALYFMDEPMHSTPPIEGAATAMAVVRHLASMEGVRVFVTTHYHTMIDLETEDPAKFINVSMEAREARQACEAREARAKFHFPYCIRKGPSRQCIAIDLLQEKAFPDEFIQSAIRYKNKICSAEIGRNHDAT